MAAHRRTTFVAGSVGVLLLLAGLAPWWRSGFASELDGPSWYSASGPAASRLWAVALALGLLAITRAPDVGCSAEVDGTATCSGLASGTGSYDEGYRMTLAELVQSLTGDELTAHSGGDFRAELQWGAYAGGLVLLLAVLGLGWLWRLARRDLRRPGENGSYVVGAEP